MKIKLFFLIGLLFSVSLFSQNKTGIGSVSDGTGTLIPNAIVQVSPASDTTIVFEYICDKNGNYEFDIASDESTFVLDILPSGQTLQFEHEKEDITLSNGDNGILFHTVSLTGTTGILFTIVDISGEPIPNAKVSLYNTKKKWRIDSCRIAKPFYTDINGQIEINSLLPIEYWFNVRNDYMTNRFTVNNITVDASAITDITVPIRDLTQKEFFMCGTCDNKTWITDSIVIFGISQPHDADSKLISDGTWSDSNDNHGFWWFFNNETKMAYDYDSTSNNGGGSTVEADIVELNDSSFVGDMEMFGLPVTYYMSAIYDDIDLNLSAHDTTVYLDSNGTASITPDDLIIDHNYCFTCNFTLSQSDFDMNDIGDVEVYVTMEDRCGNLAIDTLTITIATLQPIAINEIFKSIINVHPNPTNGFVIVESNYIEIDRIEVIDMKGETVKAFLINNKKFRFDTASLNQGVYIVRMYIANNIVTKKLIVE